jgi:hypothetical protein
MLVATFLVSTGSADEVVCRTFIPTAERPHGEVRLVRRDGAVVVQTLLYTPSLRRGLQKIRQREEANWPPERDGHADSQKYLEVLAQGKTASLAAFDGRSDKEDRHQRLLIEVLDDGRSARVDTSLPELKGATDAIEIGVVRPVATSPVSAEYARAAMEIILQSAFHRPGRTLEEFLSGKALRFDPLSEEQLSQPVTR